MTTKLLLFVAITLCKRILEGANVHLLNSRVFYLIRQLIGHQPTAPNMFQPTQLRVYVHLLFLKEVVRVSQCFVTYL